MIPEHHVPLFHALDTAANQAQRAWRFSYVRSLLVLGVIGLLAELKDLSPRLLEVKWHPYVKLFVILISMVGALYEIFYHIRHKSRFGYWTRLRAKAERLKSEAWFFLFDIGPASSPTVYSADQWQRFQELLLADDVASEYVPLIAQDDLARQKPMFQHLPPEQQAHLYQLNRVHEQYGYFTSRVQRLSQRLRQHKVLVITLLLIAVSWAGVRAIDIFYPLSEVLQEFNLFVILISAIGLTKAYIEVENVEYLINRYQQMEQHLRNFHEREEAPTGSSFRPYVQQVEEILLSQTKDWETQRLS
ncbi:hypothetical protein LJY25_19760 [Hymenobacter sp. BT175]|uniref:hypothetical protein n=1 Tax=Hymenobacter translucens TaxID=2886507 RepID=UPI001D0F308B|nr:hypothetical protein [Hymenobacter translucens]MCC2548694.1 hypothetical protein [Hymenobacter translucens]